MKRKIIKSLLEWKTRVNRKPLILNGARQVGKTYIIHAFGEENFEHVVYLNLEQNNTICRIFDGDLDPVVLISTIELFMKEKIDCNKTLIVFDEIQACPRAITALKYFSESDDNYYVIGAGSLLGVSLNQNVSFPVGKVEMLKMYPMDFQEFLIAVGEERLVTLIDENRHSMIHLFKDRLTDLLRKYYLIGGMPEVVKHFRDHQDFNEVRRIQLDLLDTYERDFSKHAPGLIVSRIRMLWQSIPTQLSKENKKFIYGQVKSGSRVKDYELALTWLLDSGLVYKINRVKKPSIPLRAYEDLSAFKLFVLDVGLLAAKVGLDEEVLLKRNKLLSEFKGALTEQFVMQQLIGMNLSQIFYWKADKGTAEVDFLVQSGTVVYPIEVKAEENLKAKSLKVFSEKYDNKYCIRTSLSDYREETWLKNIPLYAINLILHIKASEI